MVEISVLFVLLCVYIIFAVSDFYDQSLFFFLDFGRKGMKFKLRRSMSETSFFGTLVEKTVCAMQIKLFVSCRCRRRRRHIVVVAVIIVVTAAVVVVVVFVAISVIVAIAVAVVQAVLVKAQTFVRIMAC